jgi:Lhr-like helicase
MATSGTTLKAGDNLPARGKAFKTLLLEVLREESMIGLKKKATKDEANKAFIKHIANRALNIEDPNSAMLLKELITKSYPSLKPTLDKINFEFRADGTDLQKANDVLKAISTGKIPPDVGGLVMGVIKDNSVIEANTELAERIEALEKLIN